MLLALNVNNTSTIVALFRTTPATAPAAGELLAHWRISTQRSQTADEYGMLIRSLLASESLRMDEIEHVIIASVVPPLDTTLRQFCQRYIRHKPVFVEPGVKTGMPILTDNPSEVGADRVANGVGAFAKYGGPCIVVDFGTATNFDVISARGDFLGGAIAPGLNISAEALFARAARLPRVDIRKPTKVIGTNTVDNLQIGLFYGHIALVDGILARMIAELGPETKCIGTGGLASVLAGESKYITAVDDMLTIDGLRLIFERHNERSNPPEKSRNALKSSK
jgi:type III pantothenate kinase